MSEIIKKIERILSVKLAPHQYGKRVENAYHLHNGKLHELYLNNLEIETFEDVKKVYGLTIKNATISSLSELLRLNIYRLTLENVVFKNSNESIIANDTLQHVRFKNTYFNAQHLRNCADLKFAFFYDCKIENLYETSRFPKLYQLSLDNITWDTLEKSNLPPTQNDPSLTISNMQFDDIAIFSPFANITSLTVINCHIKSISNLYCFKKLENFEIDSDSIIENTEFTTHKHQAISCEITQGTQPIDLQYLFPIANHINKLSFCNLKEKQLYHIEKFNMVNTLVFDKSDAYLDAFLPIASQIKTIFIQDSSFKETKHLEQFINLTTIETNAMDDLGVKNLKELLPIKNQLKTFVSFDDECENFEFINEFSALEYLKIVSVSLSVATQILKLKSLKHLYLHVNIDEEEENQEKPLLNINNLTNLERLNISYRDINVIGYEDLKQLKSLRIENGVDEINSFPRMEHLERLNFEGQGKINISSERFPNLKELKIEGTDINLTLNLPKLEILEIPYINHIDALGEMPNLKRLYLPKTNTFSNIFKNTPNITHLHFEEFERDDLEFLQPLKKLKYLNLLNGTVSNISALNALPNLKEVNLSGLDHLESQLENPEKAVYLWINRRHFHVYDEDNLWI